MHRALLRGGLVRRVVLAAAVVLGLGAPAAAAMALGLGAPAAAALALRHPAASAPAERLQFTVSDRPATLLASAHPVAPVPPGFVGTSMDYCAISRYTGARADPVLVRLLLNLAPSRPVIRVGGSLDQPCPASPAALAPAPEAIAALARATAARLILGVDLVAGGAARVRAEARRLVSAIAPRRRSDTIEAFELGNEPDLYRRYGAYGRRSEIQSDFLDYLRDFTATASAVRDAVHDPEVQIAGPSLSYPTSPWISGQHAANFMRFLNSAARVGMVTFHVYPLHGVAPCPGKLCPSLPNLLGDRATHGLALQLAPFVRLVGPRRALRVDETNSVAQGGVAGVSNSFASALWALDALFEDLRGGAKGVNFHTFNGARYQLYSGPRPGGWLVFPEYFGLLTFARAAPAGSQLLAVAAAAAPPAGSGVKMWATRAPGGRFTVVVINKTLAAVTVDLTGSGVPAKSSARLVRLLAPPGAATSRCPGAYATTGLCATTGVTLGGASFGPPGSGIFGGEWTRSGSLVAGPGGACTSLMRCTAQPAGGGIELALPAGSVAVVSGPRARSGAPDGARAGANR